MVGGASRARRAGRKSRVGAGGAPRRRRPGWRHDTRGLCQRRGGGSRDGRQGLVGEAWTRGSGGGIRRGGPSERGQPHKGNGPAGPPGKAGGEGSSKAKLEGGRSQTCSNGGRVQRDVATATTGSGRRAGQRQESTGAHHQGGPTGKERPEGRGPDGRGREGKTRSKRGHRSAGGGQWERRKRPPVVWPAGKRRAGECGWGQEEAGVRARGEDGGQAGSARDRNEERQARPRAAPRSCRRGRQRAKQAAAPTRRRGGPGAGRAGGTTRAVSQKSKRHTAKAA